MELVHQEKKSGITYKLFIEQDDVDVRGNCLASGDDAEDRRYENEIIERLENGDTWAWAQVTVEASTVGSELVGEDHLGGCTYGGTEDFLISGYWDDMKESAKTELLKALGREVSAYMALVR